MNLKRRFAILRWSVLRTGIGIHRLSKTGHLGDGREAAAADFVVANARRGDIDDVVARLDQFAYEKSFLVNIGDQKGELLDAAVRRADPRLVLELGTYCGYSALRIARSAPSATVFSVELSPANAEVARRIWAHAGVDDRVSCLVGTVGDGGRTLDALEAAGLAEGALDFLFIDHDKHEYLPDLLRISERGWLHRGSIAVADNIRIPGSPRYRAYMRAQEGKAWMTTEHKTHVEYLGLLPDMVLESVYLG